MESKEDAAVERQKLVSDDGEIEPDDEQPPINNIIIPPSSNSNSAPKTLTQTPISPVLSHKIFSSGDTSRTQDSSNCSIGRGGGGTSETGPHSTRLIYINERKSDPKQTDYKAKARRVQRDQDESIPTAATQIPSILHHQLPTLQGSSTHDILTAPNPASSPPSPTPNTANTTGAPISSASENTDTTQAQQQTATNHQATSTNTSTTNQQRQPNTTAASPPSSAAKITFDERVLKHHSFISEVPDVRHMERALLGLLEDFHLGKLKAFGSGCTMDQMTDIREQQERLAKLHFELGAGGDPMNSNSNLNAQENMTQLVAKLENLSVSIERLNSDNANV